MKTPIRTGARLKEWIVIDSNRWRIVVVAFLIWLLADQIYEWTVIPEPKSWRTWAATGAYLVYGGATVAMLYGVVARRRWGWGACKTWALTTVIAAAAAALAWSTGGIGTAVIAAGGAAVVASGLLGLAYLAGIAQDSRQNHVSH